MSKHFINHLLHQLNCISRVAILEGAIDSQKQVKKLTDYIRYKFGRENQTVKLYDELREADNLVELYKSRFGETLNYTSSFQPEVLDIYIPHYTIMTFLENCLNHAFDNIEGTWNIRVTVNRTPEGCCITIDDNGQGYNGFSEMLELPPENWEYGSIVSTIHRLKSICRSAAKDMVEFRSSPDQGTSVVIRIRE